MRLGTLNVHNPRSRELQAIAELIKRLELDAVAVQEIYQDAARRLERLLSPPWRLTYAPAAFAGNALLTRLRILPGSCKSVEMDSAGVVGRETRSAACATVLLGDDNVQSTLVAIHLDHIDEQARILQVNELLTQGLSEEEAQSCILFGDFNALSRGDYTDEMWSKIASQRERGGWELPVHVLTDSLRSRGFVDARLEGHGSSAPLIEVEQFTRRGHRSLQTHVWAGTDVIGTCRFATRIDLLLRGPRCRVAFVPGSYHVAKTLDAGLTDHNLVMADADVRPLDSDGRDVIGACPDLPGRQGGSAYDGMGGMDHGEASALVAL